MEVKIIFLIVGAIIAVLCLIALWLAVFLGIDGTVLTTAITFTSGYLGIFATTVIQEIKKSKK